MSAVIVLSRWEMSQVSPHYYILCYSIFRIFRLRTVQNKLDPKIQNPDWAIKSRKNSVAKNKKGQFLVNES
jgi:hypothetical protein